MPAELPIPNGTPAEFGSYIVESYLGSGAFGYVYRVAHEGNTYALKWLKPDAPDHGAERMKNEIWALRELDHPSIPKVYFDGVENGRPFFVMTFARGDNLTTQIERMRKERGHFSDFQVLKVLTEMLDVVVHMQDRNITHRDIKHDNILTDSTWTRCWLLDIGCCDAPSRPYSARTFWNIGAARFSPPSKLRHPQETKGTHDVFAIGVVGYLLVTFEYPWSVPSDQDVGHLLELMDKTPPTPIERFNNTVSHQLTSLILRLIERDDVTRPTAAEALAEARSVHDVLAAEVAPAVEKSDSIILPRVIRDPIHGDVRMTEFEWRLIATPEFQRLRWIKQLGFAHYVFHGAEHSRFQHSIGSMFVADRILQTIIQIQGSISGSIREDNEWRLEARAYALVHDVVHIPFGHTLEDELGFFRRHDENTSRIQRLVLDADSELGKVLRSTTFGERVIAHFDPQSTVRRRTFVAELISSSNGADVIDYVNRDAVYSGLDERIDSAIFRRFIFRNAEGGGHLLYQSFGKHGRRMDINFALENLRMARLALFMKVYTHPVKVAASAMLGKALYESRRGAKTKAHFTEDRIERMGDLELLLALRDHGAPAARRLSNELILRRLYQPAFKGRVLKPEEISLERYKFCQDTLREIGLFDPEKRYNLEKEFASKAGIQVHDVIIYCAPTAPGYSKAKFRILREKGEFALEELLDIELLRRHSGLWFLYIFVRTGIEKASCDKIVSVASERFSMSNELPVGAAELNLPLWEMVGSQTKVK